MFPESDGSGDSTFPHWVGIISLYWIIAYKNERAATYIASWVSDCFMHELFASFLTLSFFPLHHFAVFGWEQITNFEDCGEPKLRKTEWMCRVSAKVNCFFTLLTREMIQSRILPPSNDILKRVDHCFIKLQVTIGCRSSLRPIGVIIFQF